MGTFDPRKTAIVEEGDPGVPDCEDGAGVGTAEITVDTPQHMVIEIDASQDALLVQTDSFYPGWEATLDGEVVPLMRTDLLFRGVAVPAGKHTLTLRYKPPAIRAALWVAPLAILGLLGWGIRRRPEAL